MRLLKLQISVKFLKKMGLIDLLSKMERLEILNAYQYDKKNFFSMQKIIFKPDLIDNVEDEHLFPYMKKFFGATDFDLIERPKKNLIICNMKQKRKRGFWNAFIPSGPWALIPPLVLNQYNVIVSIISTEKFIDRLRVSLRPYGRFIRILAYSVADDLENNMNVQPFPRFTNRQQEIGSYAVSHGFYESPKRITAQTIAKKFGISVSTLNEHLRKIERNAMNYLFGKSA